MDINIRTGYMWNFGAINVGFSLLALVPGDDSGLCGISLPGNVEREICGRHCWELASSPSC